MYAFADLVAQVSNLPTTFREANVFFWGDKFVAGLGSQSPISNRQTNPFADAHTCFP